MLLQSDMKLVKVGLQSAASFRLQITRLEFGPISPSTPCRQVLIRKYPTNMVKSPLETVSIKIYISVTSLHREFPSPSASTSLRPYFFTFMTMVFRSSLIYLTIRFGVMSTLMAVVLC